VAVTRPVLRYPGGKFKIAKWIISHFPQHEFYVVLGTKREKVKQYGNAVTPPVMQMLIERCVATFR